MKCSRIAIQVLLIAGAAASARAAVSYSAPASVYAQNFDSLAANSGTTNAWANDVTLAGWHALAPTNIAPTNYVAWGGAGGQ